LTVSVALTVFLVPAAYLLAYRRRQTEPVEETTGDKAAGH
jgi:hypothetical protein